MISDRKNWRIARGIIFAEFEIGSPESSQNQKVYGRDLVEATVVPEIKHVTYHG